MKLPMNRTSSGIPGMLHGILGGLLIGTAVGTSLQLAFGMIVFWLFTILLVRSAEWRAVKELRRQLSKDELVVVRSEELKKYGLEAADGELEKSDAG